MPEAAVLSAMTRHVPASADGVAVANASSTIGAGAVVHVVAGSTAFALLGIKFALIRWRPSLAYDTAPWIGRVVAVCFVAIWITSGFAFFTNQL